MNRSKGQHLSALTHIIQMAALSDSVDAQIQFILEQVSDVLGADVCSLYRRQEDDSLRLSASHGLKDVHPFIIPAGRGLTGLVMRTRQLVNVDYPETHPDYFHFPGSNEELFKTFCGAPLILRGQVKGVVVVQTRSARKLTSDQQAILFTLAIHMANLLDQPVSMFSSNQGTSVCYQGVSGSTGLAIGKAYQIREPSLSEVLEQKTNRPEEELKTWTYIKQIASAELLKEQEQMSRDMGDHLANILDSYLLILEDPSFNQNVEEKVKDGYQLPWALKETVRHFADQFRSMEDSYLKSRSEDIENIGDKLYQIWLGNTKQFQDLGGDDFILVGGRISVSAIIQLSGLPLKGIVCTEGAALSHVAVLANALNIPAVMGIGEFPVELGEPLIVDGDNGEVIHHPTTAMLREYQLLEAERKSLIDELLRENDNPAITVDSVRITLLANSGLQADIEPGLRCGAEGIGLYRTEIPFLFNNRLPSEEEQVKIYRSVLERYHDKPVYLRTLDIGSDKALPYLPEFREENPALGLRGIRYTLDHIALLNTQLRAIIRAAGETSNLRLLLPMISTTRQLDEAIELVDKTCLELQLEGREVRRPKLGIMVEVPCCISMLPFWRDKVDFISIGTNDMSQYLLATDRNNPLVSRWFDALHPAILHELNRICENARSVSLPVSVCGEMASDPVAVLYLLGMGIRQLSMSAAKIPIIRYLVREVAITEVEALLRSALIKDNPDSIRELGQQYLRTKQLAYSSLLFGQQG